MKYTVYLDESGDLNNPEIFIIGGYYISHMEKEEWNINVKKQLEELSHTYHIQKETIKHRTDIPNKHKIEITQKLLDSVKDDATFITATYDNTGKVASHLIFYVDMLSHLILRIIYSLVSDQKKHYEDYIELDLVLASRQDYQNYKKTNVSRGIIPLKDYKHQIRDKVNELQLEYGFRNRINYHIFIEEAQRNEGLVIADYICNSSFGALNKNQNETIKILSNFNITNYNYNVDNIYIDICEYRRDYYNLLDSYVRYSRIEESNKTKQYLMQEYKIKLKDIFSKITPNYSIHFTRAMLTYLKMIEEESKNIKNYPEIMETYKCLLEILTLVNIHNKEELEFIINTEYLAVSNHAGNIDKSQKCISRNKELFNRFIESITNIETGLLFHNLSAVYYQQTYETNKAIDSLRKAIARYNSIKSSLENIESKNFYRGIFNDDSLARLYGSLGQAYMMHYMIYRDEEDFLNSKNSFLKARELFGINNNNEIRREFIYLMHLSRIRKDENAFRNSLYKVYECLSDNKEATLDTVLDVISEDDYALSQILTFATFDTPYSKELRKLLVDKKDEYKIKRSHLAIQFIRDWAYIYYLENNDVSKVYLYKKEYKIIDISDSTAYKLIGLSIALNEYIMTFDTTNLKKYLKIIVEYSDVFNKIFGASYQELINNDTVDVDKIRDKLYF